MSEAMLQLTISRKRMLTPDICELELRDPAGGPLPAFEAGAHVNVETPSGAVRSYSLCNDPQETDRYVIAVKREQAGRGGSKSLVEETAEGRTIAVSEPSNAFPLAPAPKYLLIAGGIGVTPILSMARTLARQGQDFQVIYCTRSAETTAFMSELSAPEFAGRVTFHHDEGRPENAYDFWPHFEEPDASHVYCCGPAPLMDEVRDMSGHWPASAIRFEDFAGVAAVDADSRPFRVKRASTGDIFDVPEDKTILDVLRERGFHMPASCESGTCGSCRTKLVSGAVEHRDLVLTDEEKDRNIMICVSRAAGEEIVIDF
jgi:phthalate 4,5-dioxygenase reductase subunit